MNQKHARAARKEARRLVGSDAVGVLEGIREAHEQQLVPAVRQLQQHALSTDSDIRTILGRLKTFERLASWRVRLKWLVTGRFDA